MRKSDNLLKSKRMIAITSTLPRWKDDSTTSFVLDHCKLLAPHLKEVIVLAPHFKGAKARENVGPNMQIRRVKYFWPLSQQDIFYGGDAAQRISKSPLYLLKVVCYLFTMSLMVCRLRPNRDTIINPNWMIPQGLIGIGIRFMFRKSKVVTTARGADIFGLQGGVLKKVKRFVLKNSDVVVTNSKQARDACFSIYEREYFIAPSGFSEKLFWPKSSKAYNKDSKQPIKLIAAGRLSEEKGFLYILKAVKAMVKRGIDVELKIAGDGPLKAKFESYIANNNLSNYVQLLGWVNREDLPSLYRQADLFVGASIVAKSGWRESFGNVYAEAMASGIPTIVTDTAGASELITDKKDGVIIRSSSTQDIVGAVSWLHKDRKQLKSMGMAAQKTIEPYSSEATRDKYLAIFESFWTTGGSIGVKRSSIGHPKD